MSIVGTKTEIRAFFLSEYEEEKAYLEERHRQGWKLLHVWPYVYRFEACEPEAYVYESDFVPLGNSERERYVALCEEYGWEHVQDFQQFSYFRRAASEVARDGEQSLFSDNESRMDLAHRIYRHRMLPLSILLLLTLPLMMLRVVFGDPMDAPDVAIFVVYAVLLAWDLYGLIRSARGFARLKEKYGTTEPR